jgi:hypothetical protein
MRGVDADEEKGGEMEQQREEDEESETTLLLRDVLDPRLQQRHGLRHRIGGLLRHRFWGKFRGLGRHVGSGSGAGRGGQDHRQAVRQRDVLNGHDGVERDALVGLDHERGRDAAQRHFIELGAEIVERDDLVVEVEDGLALKCHAIGIDLRGRERDRDDETAQRRTHAELALRRLHLDARLEHKRRTEQKKREQEQHDRHDGHKIDQTVQRLESAGEYQGHERVCLVEATETSPTTMEGQPPA